VTEWAVCRNGLHDVTDPANVYIRPDNGTRWCKPCKRIVDRDHKRMMRHLTDDQKARRLYLEWKGPRRRTQSAIKQHRVRYGLHPYASGHRLEYAITAAEVRTLQSYADGLTCPEIAAREQLVPGAIDRRSRNIRAKYGVADMVAAVAQGLKRGAITPDKATVRHLSPKALRKNVVRTYVHQLVAVVQGRARRGQQSNELNAILWHLQARNEAHAVSILWAAGIITARHVPQTRNRYQRRTEQSR
jgi:DNA-binding CsgD family transcriptional regulator